ncbi:hypothetical protein GCM10010841_27060 [Deinococcus aerophilus]|uniref:Uncharacterized protein n=1 Tax=Deinococcus aerophilus TaxID=522488 RepID=A0ABQ2GYP4_9DEIO|nr:hypothetical protein GCM10010841_27060 [Deinococcus aerophilus]
MAEGGGTPSAAIKGEASVKGGPSNHRQGDVNRAVTAVSGGFLKAKGDFGTAAIGLTATSYRLC